MSAIIISPGDRVYWMRDEWTVRESRIDGLLLEPIDGSDPKWARAVACARIPSAVVHDTNLLIGGSVCGEMSGRDTLTTEWERVTCDGCKSVPF